MAITDNTFSLEELTNAVAANPDLAQHVVGAAKAANYVVRTADEEKTFIGSKVGEIHSRYEQDFFDTSGIAKNPNEKAYEYGKRVITGLKSDATARQTKITELETAIANGQGDATMKAQLEQLQMKEAQWQQDQEKLTKQLQEKDVRLAIRDGLRELKYDPTVKESIRNTMVDAATSRLMNLAVVQKNADNTETVVFVRDGKTLLNKDGQPANAAFLLAEELKDVLDAGHQGAGGGAGQGGQGAAGGQGGKKALPAAVPATIKTQGQLIDWLKEYGLAQNSKEFDEAFDKFSEGLALR
ncbi:hypothetical protein LJ737_04280 [Hymenobacter sp. 15J16-1T3B]|uniref:hypothetical protein n=1 Tax=Hymenobacter sp. 15J16-1T3B TaxID=2886941 RepID=UPI001D128C07|nr:hypothetical protein [Hymenobacter sp. 15J16-1T3B]MCC3156440.1 hypothetical protein [Hymenobacter sp. 15J16-1T3B]